jgi:hypothetical protein
MQKLCSRKFLFTSIATCVFTVACISRDFQTNKSGAKAVVAKPERIQVAALFEIASPDGDSIKTVNSNTHLCIYEINTPILGPLPSTDNLTQSILALNPQPQPKLLNPSRERGGQAFPVTQNKLLSATVRYLFSQEKKEISRNPNLEIRTIIENYPTEDAEVNVASATQLLLQLALEARLAYSNFPSMSRVNEQIATIITNYFPGMQWIKAELGRSARDAVQYDYYQRAQDTSARLKLLILVSEIAKFEIEKNQDSRHFYNQFGPFSYQTLEPAFRAMLKEILQEAQSKDPEQQKPCNPDLTSRALLSDLTPDGVATKNILTTNALPEDSANASDAPLTPILTDQQVSQISWASWMANSCTVDHKGSCDWERCFFYSSRTSPSWAKGSHSQTDLENRYWLLVFNFFAESSGRDASAASSLSTLRSCYEYAAEVAWGVYYYHD